MGIKTIMVLSLTMTMSLFGAMSMMSNSETTTNSRYDLSCPDALQKLVPCQGYVNGTGGEMPTLECCLGIDTVLRSVETTKKRRAMCVCLKVAALTHTVDLDRAAKVADLCHIPVPIPFYPRVDCGKIDG